MAANAVVQWDALRALREGRTVSFDLLAAASGRARSSIENRARKEGWATGGQAGGKLDRKQRIDRQIDRLIGRIEALCADCDAKGTLDKVSIEAISSLTRTLEKIGEITRSGESAKENQIKKDGDIADVLRRIDQRIIELATDYAKQLGASEPQG